jgi:NAD(P)-dependent dehydrogenase (short-subunit alcohol dehydrogenase family)
VGAVVLVTGASRGIRRATAESFAEAGATVVICARSRDGLAQTAARIKDGGGIVWSHRCDLASPRNAATLIRMIMRRFGRLDVLINNAGILGPRVPIADYPLRAWREVLDVNLTGTFAVTQAAARAMMRQGSGCIISISSSVGRRGRARWGAYAVSKFGVEGLTQVLAEELAPTGVCVVTYNPGGTRTRMRAEAYPDEDPATVRDPTLAARAIVALASSVTMEMSGRAFERDAPAERA